MSPRAVRLGLIGAGPWGRVIIGAFKDVRGARLALVASRNPETASLAPSGCGVTRDWKDLARADDLDGVLIATPPALHVPMAAACVRTGKAVFVEKPLSLDPAEARSLLRLARRRKAFVLVDHVHLFHPAYRRLKETVRRAGEMRYANPLAIRSTGGNRGPFRRDTPPLWDYGPHDLSMALDLTGEDAASVHACLKEVKRLPAGLGEIWDLALNFPSSASASIRVGNLLGRKVRKLSVWAFPLFAFYDGIRKDKLLTATVTDSSRWRSVPFDPTPPLTVALNEFVTGVRAGSTDLSSLELGVRVVEHLSRCEASARAGGAPR